MQLKEWQISALYSYIVGDLTEVVRIPAVLALCPVIHRKLYKQDNKEGEAKSEEKKTGETQEQ